MNEKIKNALLNAVVKANNADALYKKYHTAQIKQFADDEYEIEAIVLEERILNNYIINLTNACKRYNLVISRINVRVSQKTQQICINKLSHFVEICFFIQNNNLNIDKIIATTTT
jgi:hypothetical protein